MKTYAQFAAEMSPESREEARRLFESVYVHEENPLMCYSDRATDAAHFKQVPISEAELALLNDS